MVTHDIPERKLARWPEGRRWDLAGANHIRLDMVIFVSIEGNLTHRTLTFCAPLLLCLRIVQRSIPPSSGTKLNLPNYSGHLPTWWDEGSWTLFWLIPGSRCCCTPPGWARRRWRSYTPEPKTPNITCRPTIRVYWVSADTAVWCNSHFRFQRKTSRCHPSRATVPGTESRRKVRLLPKILSI